MQLPLQNKFQSANISKYNNSVAWGVRYEHKPILVNSNAISTRATAGTHTSKSGDKLTISGENRHSITVSDKNVSADYVILASRWDYSVLLVGLMVFQHTILAVHH